MASDSDFVLTPSDPLPDRLKRYLFETARQELDALRAALDERLIALEKALAHPDRHESLEALVLDLARVATLEAEAAAARVFLEAQQRAQEHAGPNPEAERALEAERAGADALRQELARVRTALDSDLSRARGSAQTAADELVATKRELVSAKRAVQKRAADLEAARQEVTAAAAGRQAIEAEKAEAVRGRQEAEIRTQRVEARLVETEARAQRGEARAADAEARAARAESRLAETEARALDAGRTRDAITMELNATLQASNRDRAALAERQKAERARLGEYEQRLASAAAEIRALELQVSAARDRPPQSLDHELSALLDGPRGGPHPTRAATRYRVASRVGVRIDGVDGIEGVLVDLSTAGAQVLMSGPLEQDSLLTLSLLSDEVPTSCKGKVVWTRLDPNSKGQRLRYRAGMKFTAVDASAVEALIIRHG